MSLNRIEAIVKHGEPTIQRDINHKISRLSEPSDLFDNFSSAYMTTTDSFTWESPTNNFHRFFDKTEGNTARQTPAFQRFQLLYPEESEAITRLIQQTLEYYDNDSYHVLALPELQHVYAIMRHLVSTSDPYSDNPDFLRG